MLGYPCPNKVLETSSFSPVRQPDKEASESSLIDDITDPSCGIADNPPLVYIFGASCLTLTAQYCRETVPLRSENSTPTLPDKYEIAKGQDAS